MIGLLNTKINIIYLNKIKKEFGLHQLIFRLVFNHNFALGYNARLCLLLLLSGRDGGFGRPVLDNLIKPLHLFDLMRRHRFLDRNNIIYLQAMLYKIGRPDLYDSAIEYAQSVGETIHFSKPPTEPGIVNSRFLQLIDFELKKVLLPPLGNFADISYLEENFKPHLLRDVCTLCSGALVSDSLLHMLLLQTKEKIKMKG